MICAPSEDSDQPGQLPSLIRVFTVRSIGSERSNVSSCEQRRLWSDWADDQADLSLRWVHMPFCWFCHEAAHLWLTLENALSEVSLNTIVYWDAKETWHLQTHLYFLNMISRRKNPVVGMIKYAQTQMFLFIQTKAQYSGASYPKTIVTKLAIIKLEFMQKKRTTFLTGHYCLLSLAEK